MDGLISNNKFDKTKQNNRYIKQKKKKWNVNEKKKRKLRLLQIR